MMFFFIPLGIKFNPQSRASEDGVSSLGPPAPAPWPSFSWLRTQGTAVRRTLRASVQTAPSARAHLSARHLQHLSCNISSSERASLTPESKPYYFLRTPFLFLKDSAVLSVHIGVCEPRLIVYLLHKLVSPRKEKLVGALPSVSSVTIPISDTEERLTKYLLNKRVNYY